MRDEALAGVRMNGTSETGEREGEGLRGQEPWKVVIKEGKDEREDGSEKRAQTPRSWMKELKGQEVLVWRVIGTRPCDPHPLFVPRFRNRPRSAISAQEKK